MFTYIITNVLIQSSSVIFSVFENMRIGHFNPKFISIMLSGFIASILWTYLYEYHFSLQSFDVFNFLEPISLVMGMQKSDLYNSPILLCLCDMIISNLLMFLVGFYYLEIPSVYELEKKIYNLKSTNHDLLVNVSSLDRNNRNTIMKNLKLSTLNDELYDYIDNIHENTSFTINSIPKNLTKDAESDSDYEPNHDLDTDTDSDTDNDDYPEADLMAQAKNELKDLIDEKKLNKRNLKKAINVYKAKIFNILRKSNLICQRDMTPLLKEISKVEFNI